ncbi:MAG: hypothetical protein LBF05_02865, partial [Tannerella sp.]|nr:hypothetical protein [Tannerella sp.]
KNLKKVARNKIHAYFYRKLRHKMKSCCSAFCLFFHQWFAEKENCCEEGYLDSDNSLHWI